MQKKLYVLFALFFGILSGCQDGAMDAMLSDSNLASDASSTNGRFYASGTRYYVAVDGSNSGDGSEENPWATLKYACRQVAPNEGNMIVLGEGTFSDANRKDPSNTPAILPENVSLRGQSKVRTIYQGEIRVPKVRHQLIERIFMDGRENTNVRITLFEGLVIGQGSEVEVREMRIEGYYGNGLRFGQGDGLTNSSLHGSFLINNGVAHTRGFAMKTGNLKDSEIYNNTFAEERGRGGEPWNTGNSRFENVKIYNNRFTTHNDTNAGWLNPGNGQRQVVFNFELFRVDCENVEIYGNEFDGSISLIDDDGSVRDLEKNSVQHSGPP